MSVSTSQRLIDTVWVVSWQRWVFGAVSVAAAGCASIAGGLAAGSQNGVVIALVLALAAGAAASPDSHTALAVEVVVVWQWLASTDDPTSPWVIAVAVALLVFHVVVALMATTPITTIVDSSILQRWAVRSLAIVVAVVAVWALVVVADEREASGSVLLTIVAFVTLAAIVTSARARLAPRSPDIDTD
jgi:hypothetical protein